MKTIRIVVGNPREAHAARQTLNTAFREIVLERGREMVISIGTNEAPQSRSQRGLMHKWFGEIADQTGHDPEEIKEVMKDRFLPKVEVSVFGKTEMLPKRTRDLTHAETMDFMTRIQRTCAEYGIYITDPDLRRWEEWAELAREDRDGREVQGESLSLDMVEARA
ncbi:MAG: hypothetical protein V2J24_20135 [Pseudomonadales bacterium]|jgi:hypothetical protein|nr:hypothetical protein [Pseudomonadales bacterium]